MDPQTAAFTPQSELWRLTDTMRVLQQTQQDHADRLARLERRQDGDARMKSVWGPQQASQADFSGFEDDEPSNNMVRSLHLDTDDEPRRLAATSRANSVRFDESTKPGQWNHAPRGSVDLLSRASAGFGGIGGHPMFERSTSHKSDGRQSSAGQSVSGRANSLGLDTSQYMTNSAIDLPGFAPGMMLLGPVPSIIRCWLNMNFRHDALLYAAVCTGSYRSYLDMRLIESLGLSSQVRHDINGNSKIKLPVYLPEAISQPATSRPNSPTPRLPCITVDFLVVDRAIDHAPTKAIQIFIGSDVLQSHSADILFSTNSLSIFDDDKTKLSVPLVRPENEETFKTLCVTSVPVSSPRHPIGFNSASQSTHDLTSLAKGMPNGFEIGQRQRVAEITPPGSESGPSKYSIQDTQRLDTSEFSDGLLKDSTTDEDDGQRLDRKLLLNRINTSQTDKDSEEGGVASTTRASASPAAWGTWRRDDSSTPVDWASVSRNASGTYQRVGRDSGGIKVLKPSSARQPSRSGITSAQSPSTPQSRFFDEGRRRGGSGVNTLEDVPQAKPSISREDLKSSMKESAISGSSSTSTMPVLSKTRSANPVGGASAFGWLNSSGK